MRTTLDLDEDILQLAKHLARERNESIGRVVSELVRQGLKPSVPTNSISGIPTLAPKHGARPVTAEAVRELLESEN
jgi:hypothetical protein